jgi:hypothetical protein
MFVNNCYNAGIAAAAAGTSGVTGLIENILPTY